MPLVPCVDWQFRFRGEVRVSGVVRACVGVFLVLRDPEAIPAVLQQGAGQDSRRGRNRQRKIRRICRGCERQAHAADTSPPDLHCRRVQRQGEMRVIYKVVKHCPLLNHARESSGNNTGS